MHLKFTELSVLISALTTLVSLRIFIPLAPSL